MSVLMGLGIYFVYKKTFQGVLYQKSFNVSLIAITVILTFIIMIIKGNLVLSLGMVGALSIVRFRTPIKDPVDLVFIFWAISVGIANGVGFFHISLITSVLITIVLFVMLKFKENNISYLLILQLSDANAENNITKMIKSSVDRYHLKSKSINPDFVEIISEVRIKNADTSFVSEVNKNKGVNKITLITSNDDLTSF